MRRHWTIPVALLVTGLLAAGCGESGNLKDAKNIGTAPNVIGLPLPDAREKFEAAGTEYAVESAGTLLGIVVEEHWTVCEEEGLPSGAVRILVRKDQCK